MNDGGIAEMMTALAVAVIIILSIVCTAINEENRTEAARVQSLPPVNLLEAAPVSAAASTGSSDAVITLTRGACYLNDEEVSFDELVTRLEKADVHEVLIRCDETLTHGEYQNLLLNCQKAGVTRCVDEIEVK